MGMGWKVLSFTMTIYFIREKSHTPAKDQFKASKDCIYKINKDKQTKNQLKRQTKFLSIIHGKTDRQTRRIYRKANKQLKNITL